MEIQHLLANPKFKELWGKSYTTELARLAHGIPGVSKGTNTIVLVKRNDIPIDRQRDTTYGRICAYYHPEKDDPNRMRLRVGGNLLNVPGDCGTPTVDMVTVKLHLNSVILTKGAHYCTIDLKDFYLNTPMARLEYMGIRIKDLPGVRHLIQPRRQSRCQWICLHQNTEGHVWPPPGGDTCTGTPQNTPQQTWLLPEPPHTGPLAP